MQLIKLPVVVLTFVILLPPVDLAHAAPARSLSGRLVFESPGVSCTPCRVSLIAPSGQPIGMTFADSAGNFTFENIAAGSYTIHVEIEGFERIDQEVSIMDAFPSNTATILVNAKPLRAQDRGRAAIIDASEFLSGYPKKAVNSYKKGLENKKKGNRDESIRNFEDAINIAPNFYNAHNELGMAYRAAGRKEDAEKAFLRAHELNRNVADPLVNLTGLYIDENQPERAVETGEQAVKANSRSAPAFFSLGVALYKFAQLDRAEAALKKALELAPKMFQARLFLANVYLQQNRYDNLMDQLDRYLAENPNGEQRPAVEEMRRKLIEARQEANTAAAE